MALIPDLPSSNSMSGSDLLIKDTGSATQQITFSNFKQAIVGPCAVYKFSITSGHNATVTFGSNAVGVLVSAAGWIQSGFGYLSYVCGYVSGTRLSNTVLKAASQIAIDLTSTSGQFVISNSSSTSADFVLIDLQGTLTGVTVS